MPPVVLFVLVAVFCISGAQSTEFDDEGAALLSMKSSLDDPLGYLNGWSSGNQSSHCNWTGISCDSDRLVTGIDLSNLNLTGNVSDAIQSFHRLSFLNLCCNSLYSLPRSVSKLTMLTYFDVSSNQIAGDFPSGLDAAIGLVTINGSGNNFTGFLPEEIGNLSKIETLDLRGSLFRGKIPVSYKNMKTLKFLGLSGNNLGGRIPAELGQLETLESLIMGYNQFEGSIPPEFGNLTNLQYLDLALANIGGTIPAELGRLPHLNTVFLYKNKLEGSIPPEVGNITSLAMLDLSDNLLSGEVPVELSNLKSLQLLNLMCNHLNGSIPAGIGKLANLEVLELWNNSFTGSLPPDLGQHSALQWLDVSSNSFSGEMPPALCNGGALTKLILFNNGFSGSIPAGLSRCASLVRVRIQDNRLVGSIPTGFGTLPKLERLELANNSLSGRVPTDLSQSLSLSFLDLSRNMLQSSLPSNLVSMPNLQSFLASNNNLTGPIPDQFQDCPSLSVLDLSNNHLSGDIPASLGSCEKLVTLNLMNNRLTGEIPATLATMPALAILDLSSNLLTGRIPDNFGSSPTLESFNVSYNRLSGPVPMNGMLRTVNPNDLTGNVGLCGGVLPPCLGASSAHSAAQRRHVRHVLLGWLIGMCTVAAVGLAVAGGRWAYKRHLNGESGFFLPFFRGRAEGKGDWPWRLTAFQRLSFTSSEVVACIKEANVIGMGAAGIVYRAEIPRTRSVVAVKKLWRMETADDEMDRNGELIGEVNLLGRLRHRNVLRLLGYLHNHVNTMLLYEYMPNGSLGEALHGRGSLLMDWVSRYNVAIGVAQGLCYLHHDCYPPVIHRDVKSNNILLDSNLEARIADFGLARLMVRKYETISTVAGSCGYIAPECGYTSKVDQRIDIYSFGVVLMELVTGKKPLEPEFGEGVDIVEWILRMVRNKVGIEQALDPNIAGQCRHVQEEMLLVLRIALLCTAKQPKDRPSMRDVVTMLGEAKPRRKSSDGKERPIFTPPPISSLL
ncbi:Leucine-rich repeat receptor-like protein kinase [Nymphaea thermarum]|nr:Leucine-rich repeat receptor-like protein kinase [Nymphaea thermarum]